VTREGLRQRLWASDTFVDFDHSLNTAVKKLRQALGDEADTPRYIETLPKRGYRFIGEVEREETKQEPKADTQEPVAVAVLPIGQLEPRPLSRMHRWRWVVIGAAVVLLVVAAGAAHFALKPEPQPRIVGSHVLTKTGNVKSFLSRPFADRGTVYFIEERSSGAVELQVPAEGGEVSAASVGKGLIADVSRDGSEMLSVLYDPGRKICDAWTQPVSGGIPRLVVEDACQAAWRRRRS